MFKIFGRDFYIAGSEAVFRVPERPLQNQGQFHAAMPVIRNGLPGRNVQQARGCPRVRFQDGLPHPHAHGPPSDRRKVAAHVITQRGGKHAAQTPRRPCRLCLRPAADAGQRCFKAVVRHAHRGGILDKRAAKGIKGHKTRPAVVTQRHMRGHDKAEGLGQLAC